MGEQEKSQPQWIEPFREEEVHEIFDELHSEMMQSEATNQACSLESSELETMGMDLQQALTFL